MVNLGFYSADCALSSKFAMNSRAAWAALNRLRVLRRQREGWQGKGIEVGGSASQRFSLGCVPESLIASRYLSRVLRRRRTTMAQPTEVPGVVDE